MENIIKLETIQDYNNLLGTKTLHPLVSVADLSTLMVLLWIASTIGMLWEMIKKFKTWWLIIYFPWIWSIGFLIIALILQQAG